MTTRFADHLLEGTHAERDALTGVPTGTLFSCSDHALIYQWDGAAWTTWATLGSGAGGGAAFQYAASRYSSGTTTITSANIAQVTNSVAGAVKVQIPAAAGDLLEVGVNLQAADNVATWMDLNVATFVGGVETNRVGGTGTSGSIASWTIRPSDFWGVSGNAFYTAVAGDISAGIVELRLMAKRGGTTNRAIFSTTAAPLDIWVKNHGQ